MPEASSRPQRFQPNPRVRIRELADEAVLLDLETGTYYGLNATGRRVWELLANGLSLPATLAAMESELEVPRATLEADVEALLTDLERAGLLARVD
jgi:Coenzyme PQQ synthesis protein D (PqqD)